MSNGVKIAVSPETKCIYAWLFDSVVGRDLADLVTGISESAAFEPRFNELVDLSLADSFPVSSGVLAQAALACNSLFSPTSKRVIFAPGDLAYGIARMFQAYAERGAEVFVVRTKAEACSLLNLTEYALPHFHREEDGDAA